MKLRLPWGIVDQAGSATGSKRTVNTGRTSQSSANASTASINRQIRSLVPGQTIRGEVLSRNGNDVQIRISDDMVLQAKVDQNMNLEVGKSMTFEVRNNGSALTLSPLFENMSADVNVLKALDMAGLPVNETSVSMTRQMMEAGLSVDRNSLQQMYRDVSSFPQAEVSDIVNLHKLGLPVNETNVNQMISYRNLTHQLLDGMETVLEAMPEALEGMMEEGNLQGLAGLYQELFELVQEGVQEGVTLPQESAQQAAASDMGEMAEAAGLSEMIQDQAGATLQETELEAHLGSTPAGAAGVLLDELAVSDSGSGTGHGATSAESVGMTDNAVEGAVAGRGEAVLSEAARQTLADQLLDMLSELPMDTQEAEQLAGQLRQFGQGSLATEDFFAVMGRMLQSARTAEDGIQNMHRIFSGGDFKNLMSETLKSLWTVRPEELANPGKVEELYRRMDRQLKNLTQALEAGGQAESGAFRAASSMSQNIDFLNQLNQMYTYVQLPLHLSQGEAHGDLYVYTNRRGLSSRDGKISALLHLDMEHLGPVDVYVTLEQSKVNTKFYVRDEEMLDFLGEHMHILTERLAKRGYDCSFSMTARDEGQDEAENSGIRPILDQEKGLLVTQYAFDVRT